MNNQTKYIIKFGVILGVLTFLISLISFYYESNYLHPYSVVIYTCPDGTKINYTVHKDNLSSFDLEKGMWECKEYTPIDMANNKPLENIKIEMYDLENVSFNNR